jgi:hypothetical protein
VRDVGAKGEADDSEMVRLAKVAVVLARLDNLRELDEDGLLNAQLVLEAGDPEFGTLDNEHWETLKRIATHFVDSPVPSRS